MQSKRFLDRFLKKRGHAGQRERLRRGAAGRCRAPSHTHTQNKNRLINTTKHGGYNEALRNNAGKDEEKERDDKQDRKHPTAHRSTKRLATIPEMKFSCTHDVFPEQARRPA